MGMDDARTREFEEQARRKWGWWPLLPISGGAGEGEGEGEKIEVAKAEFDRLQAQVKSLGEDAARREVAAKKAQRDAAAGRETLRVALEAFGIEELPEDPEERQRIFDEVRKQRDAAAKGKTFTPEEVKRQLDERDKRYAKELEAVQTKRARDAALLRSLMITKAARIAALEAGATEAGAEAIQYLIEREAALDEDGDELVVIIRDGRDGRKLGPTGAPMTIEDRVAEIAADKKYDSFFRATGAAGAGSRGSGDGRKGAEGKRRITREEFERMPMAEYEKVQAEILSGAVQIIDR